MGGLAILFDLRFGLKKTEKEGKEESARRKERREEERKEAGKRESKWGKDGVVRKKGGKKEKLSQF